MALSLHGNTSPEQTDEVFPAMAVQEQLRKITNPKISYSEAAKKSTLQSQSNQRSLLSTKDVKPLDTLSMVEVTQSLTRLQTDKQISNNIDHLYHGQPEPEDCVLKSAENRSHFHLESSADNSSKVKKSRRNRKKRTLPTPNSSFNMRPVLVWFRRDLRLYDNPALVAALESGAPIIPVFLWCLTEESRQNFTLATGGATRYWLHHALLQLNKSLKDKYGSQLIFRVDWAATIRATWDFSEDGAFRCLGDFLEDGINHYEKESGRADKPYTSHISPYLHFGQISPRTVLHEAHFTKKSVPKFLRKLAWRDLAYWLLALFPEMSAEPIRPAYKSQRWSANQKHLQAWQKGMTGYPLVDAAMRELWLSGWMSNYSRHVVASFLVAYLHIHWVHGYRWFQDTLVDADVAINAMMWQNGGMSGLDHWNFVMHPVDAALTCDPYGSYVRKWCPELDGLPDDYIHKPWKCPPAQLRRAGVVLGENYPHRIAEDLEERREQSLKDVVEVRHKHPEYVDDVSGCDMVPIPDSLLASTSAHAGEDEMVQGRSGRFLLPVITRMEFKYKTLKPLAKDNPYNAVLKGYVGRTRDQTIAYMNERHFTARALNETAQMYDRRERAARLLEGLPPSTDKTERRRTPASGRVTVIPPAYLHL